MSETLITEIAKSHDQSWLERCRDHNIRLGRKQVVDAVKARLRDLELEGALRLRPDESETIEHRVFEAVRVYRALLRHKHGYNQSASYTERAIKRYGAKEAVIRTVRKGKVTEGLRLLKKYGRLDCAYEQIVLDFPTEFPEDVVEKATTLLAEVAREDG